MKQFSLLLLFACIATISKAQTSYLPPTNNTLPWDTISPQSLGWCQPRIDSLYTYLNQEQTKGFIILKDGKIVLEKYFGTFTKDSNWYWASAGKTLTAFLIGQAQDEGYLTIQDTTATHLGTGWTDCTTLQENKIKIIHQLTMTSGLDDGVPQSDCTIDTCLKYLALPGFRWAYHNAPYTLLEKVIENATSSTINSFTASRVKNKIGMNGVWLQPDFNNVFWSTPRSMARFGLLIQNNGIWGNDTLLKNTTYKNAMITPSQNLNKSYGYLWWLNGYANYMLPGSQFIVPGPICPDAPMDMYSGIGKNGQLVSVSPSNNMVMVRMGDNANTNAVSTQLLNFIWKHINGLACEPANVKQTISSSFKLSPNPVHDFLQLHLNTTTPFDISISNIIGNVVMRAKNKTSLDVAHLPSGIYLLKINQDGKSSIQKFTKH